MTDGPYGLFHEAGEAIGNVGRRVFRKRNRRREAEEALERWSKLVPLPVIPPTRQGQSPVDDDVIDTTWHVIHQDKGEQDD